MMDDDDDDDESIPVPRRSFVDRHAIATSHFISDHEDSPYDRRLSRCLLNNSISIDSGVDEAIQTPIQLIALYEKTIELAAKNKINARNAFQLPLVERLPEILNIIAFDDNGNSIRHEPNFVKAGSVIDTSAKIYGYRVDALHTETQKLNGSIHQTEEEEASMTESERTQTAKKITQRSKQKASSYLVTDLSTISLPYEFDFHPFQPSTMCQWPGGVGFDSIYADMVSYTMYSSSDFPLINGFINLNSRVNREYDDNETILDITMKTNYDLIPLREAIKDDQECNHLLGCQTLREFSFNEESTDSYIDTIDECSLIDSSLLSSQEDAAMSNEIFSHGCSELRDDPSQFYFQELQSAHTFPTTMMSMEMTRMHSRESFVDHIPHLLRDTNNPSDYNYYDATKLKLFAGPYLWKYTNLLPERARSQPVSEQQSSFVRIPMKQRSVRSTRSFKIDLCHVEQQRTLGDLMNPQILSRRATKRHPRRVLPITMASTRRAIQARRDHRHQLRLTRRILPLKGLTSLHHFPDCNLEMLSQTHEKYSIIDENDPYFDSSDADPPQFIEPMEYDFIRPIHYDKIEVDRNFSKVDAKKLQIQLVDEYNRQSNSTSTITLSSLFVELLDQGLISYEKDQIVSAFYCMLNNCHKNHLYMRNNLQRDDLLIQKQLSTDSAPLFYSHALS